MIKMKPMPGFVVAVLQKKELPGKLEQLEKGLKNDEYSDIIVKVIHKDDVKTLPFKVGDNIYILPTAISPQLKLPEQGNPCLVPIRDIMSYEASK